jgi:hypothetical protein
MIAVLRRYRAYTPLLVLLLVGAIAGFFLQERDEERRGVPSLFSRDSRPDGTLGLALWLERMGLDVSRVEWTEAVPDESVDLLFVLRPTRRFRLNEAEDVVDWVTAGRTLVYHPNLLFTSTDFPSPADGLSGALGLDARRITRSNNSRVGIPLATRPELSDVGSGATLELVLNDPAWVPLLMDGSRVVGASRSLGRGRVYAFTTPSLFDNQHIVENGNRDVILNLLAGHPNVRRVAFDEYHHGSVLDPDLMTAVRTNPWGWAILYAAGATLLFLIWGGRRFGPPIVPEPVMGRSTGDYVSALAGLIQRSRSVSWTQRESARLARRELSRLLGTRPDASIADIASALRARRGASPDLSERIRDLEGAPLSERALIDCVRAVERDLRSLRGVEVSA